MKMLFIHFKNNKDFEFELMTHPVTGEQVKTIQILPQDFNSDGFFITKIKRKVKMITTEKRKINSCLILKNSRFTH